MSKQSEAKIDQNYRRTLDTCGNCAHYKFQAVDKTYLGFNGLQTWTEEKDKRCAVGKFAVQKTATCDKHVLAEYI